ncbi:NAD(P)-binding domain-containing protein [Nannocystaceae bacterium ST9]
MSEDTRPLVAVLGAGRFGQALARGAARTGEVLVWSRRDPGFDHPNIRVTATLAEVAQAELILLAAPSRHAPMLLHQAGHHLDGGHLLVHVSRGLLDDELHTLSHLIKLVTPCRRVGALAGPINTELLIKATPGAAVVGSDFPEVIEAVRKAIGGPTLRIYGSDDLRGVELAAALTGLLLFTVGYTQRLGLGPASLGALVTRGVSEIARIGHALGAEFDAFGGLACFGDLLAAVAGSDRPELVLGHALAGGATPEQAREQAGGSIEGLDIARRVAEFGVRRKIHTPLAQTIADIVEGKLSNADALRRVMQRDVGSE